MSKKMNRFNFNVLWIGKDGKVRNGNNSCLDRKKKIKAMNVI